MPPDIDLAVGGRNAKEGFELFHTPLGEAFVDVWIKGHRETYPIRSDAFARLLAIALHRNWGKAPSRAELSRQIDLAEAQALQSSAPERDVRMRVGWSNDRIYIDLGDGSWRAIEVSSLGWQVIQTPPVRFVRTPGMLPLPTPARGGSIESLRTLVNVPNDDDFVLVVSFALGVLGNRGGQPVLAVGGAEGTAKTTLVQILQGLLDPNRIPLAGLPTTERGLGAWAQTRYLLIGDNISGLSRPISNALCRLATGRPAHPIILNGITDAIKEPDLSDRCIFINSDGIRDDQRRPELQLWREFDEARPQILGALFDALSHALKVLPSVRPPGLPRMADFAVWGAACETAFWPRNTFLSAYQANRRQAVEQLVEADPIACSVQRLMDDRSIWNGTATRLLIALGPFFPTTTTRRPVSARDLSAKLRKLVPALGKLGIAIGFSREGHDGERVITIIREHAHQESHTTGAPPPGPTGASMGLGGFPSSEPSAALEADEDSLTASLKDFMRAPAAGEQSDDNADNADNADSADDADDADDANNSDDQQRLFADNDLVLRSHVVVGGRKIPVFSRLRRRNRRVLSGESLRGTQAIGVTSGKDQG